MADLIPPDCGTPADAFLLLWQAAEGMSGFQRQTAEQITASSKAQIEAALKLADARAVCQALAELIPLTALRYEQNGLILAIMHAIDDAFLRIHPRSQISPSHKTRAPLPAWLRALSERRLLYGYYAQTPEYSLIPRGPLARNPRSEHASCAENMADRFTALSLVPRQLKLGTRTISLQYNTTSSRNNWHSARWQAAVICQLAHAVKLVYYYTHDISPA